MEKTRAKGKELMKVIAVSGLSIALFSATLVGFNNVVFAEATSVATPLQPIGAAMEITQALPRQVETEVGIQSFEPPNITVAGGSGLNRHANNTVSAAAMPMDEAAQIGALYIWDIFGESIDGMHVEMLFGSWPSHSRAYWIGIVFPTQLDEIPDNDMSQEAIDARIARANSELYRFIIDAVTGLRIDISPGFGYVSQLTQEERQALDSVRITDEQIAWHVAWQEKTTSERMAYLGLSQEDIEPYLETAREFARRHFNNSAVAYETESFNVLHNVGRHLSRDVEVGLGGIELVISDDTGREAIIMVNAGTHRLRSGLGIRTEHNDFIPGFSYYAPGGRG